MSTSLNSNSRTLWRRSKECFAFPLFHLSGFQLIQCDLAAYLFHRSKIILTQFNMSRSCMKTVWCCCWLIHLHMWPYTKATKKFIFFLIAWQLHWGLSYKWQHGVLRDFLLKAMKKYPSLSHLSLSPSPTKMIKLLRSVYQKQFFASAFSGLLKLKSPRDILKNIHSPSVQLQQDYHRTDNSDF